MAYVSTKSAARLNGIHAADFVLTYAISLLALFGSAYAVIPLLLAHPVREPDVQPAG